MTEARELAPFEALMTEVVRFAAELGRLAANPAWDVRPRIVGLSDQVEAMMAETPDPSPRLDSLRCARAYLTEVSGAAAASAAFRTHAAAQAALISELGRQLGTMGLDADVIDRALGDNPTDSEPRPEAP